MMKPFLLAVLSGLILSIAWPTYGFPLFLFIGFVPLLLAEHFIRTSESKHKKKLVFFSAYACFLLFNLSTTWWLYFATPFGMLFANFANAFLMTLVFFAYHLIASKMATKLSLISLVCLWIGFEKFHLNWELSWPWLNLGNGFANNYKWVQWYEYTGVFGGTLWVWLVNCLLYKSFLNFYTNKNSKLFIKGILGAVTIIIIGVFSSLYLYETTETPKEKVRVLVLQPNVDPYTEKYNVSNISMAQNLINLASEKLDSTVAFIIAPETTLPKPRLLKTFEKTQEYLLLHNFIQKNPSATFLSGITFVNSFTEKDTPNATANFYRNSKEWYNSFNSSFFIQNNKKTETYHKSKLVVGVEHIPYRAVLNPLLGNSMIDLGGSVSTLTTQKYRKVFSNGSNTMAPIICYESIYGEYVTDYTHKGADFFAIITNDGWWNNSQGHKQHLSMARLRAIENRRSIARSANTGISALINTKGDIMDSLAYEEKGVLKGAISTNKEITFYAQHGDYIFRIAMLTLVIILLGSFTRRRGSAN
ncbi:apolipoprotein N-acyltransferase [Flavicella sediminum]|uniref:apolipoprotein N-acyltransferase n=1 Tax=Flavicella sediminum TaxID=2585141 RepID=UPI001120C962|nr:apolipoprotein N-acyltransferase [Flavicella sediminum]